MHPNLYTVSTMALTLFSLVLLLLSRRYCLRPYNPSYMKTFPIYTAVNVLAELTAILCPSQKKITYSLFTLFELLYLTWFLTRLIQSGRKRRLIWRLTSLSLLLNTYTLIKQGIDFTMAIALLQECVILIIPCLLYLREIFVLPPTLNLFREPAFWMVTGFLFYFTTLIPTLLFSGYFAHLKMQDLADATYSVNNYVQICIYFLFINAMICRRKISY